MQNAATLLTKQKIIYSCRKKGGLCKVQGPVPGVQSTLMRSYLLLAVGVGQAFNYKFKFENGKFSKLTYFSGDAIQTVELYDPIREEWSFVSPMNKRRCGVGVAVLGKLVKAIFILFFIFYYICILFFNTSTYETRIIIIKPWKQNYFQIIWYMPLEVMMVPVIYKQ